MDVEHLDAEVCRFDGRLGDGVGDVVKFEIQENFAAEFLDELHRLRSGVGEKLLADFEHADLMGQQPDELFDLVQIVDIEGDDDSIAHRSRGAHQLEPRGH